ncbi:two-component system sensor histidine kinase BaeS [Salsuginibacillus halophilus]|uniref:histidine kinase n=1 Tax=Salsuginibacillus halophilus TaxID=517424 RepID=A0A2P8HAJ5_9BACI|nr:two-component system sensor histidine kinase BaeS [Salsuginibacillus halophilus]
MHTIIISLIALVSGYFIYAAACSLVDQLPAEQDNRGQVFREQFGALLVISVPLVTLIGAFFHYYFSKKVIRPIQQLEHSVTDLKKGVYPEEVTTSSFKELENLSTHMNDLSRRLQENEVLRDKMMTDMAHELRTPFSNINGYLEALKTGVIDGSPQLYASLHKEAQKLTGMIDQLQEMNRWNEHSPEILGEKYVQDIQPVLEETSEMFMLKFQEQGIPFEVKVEAAKLTFHKEAVEQAVANLLNNAYDYYEGSQPVKLQGHSEEEVYRISVISPGPFISEADRKWLFERFYRADHSRSRKTGGTGLGLSIVKDIIVQHHGGAVSVTSEKGVHTFELNLPL